MAKTVLITGANRGIGQQVARMLATEGWDVLVGARDKQKADTAAARLRKDTGGRVKGVVIDVTSDVSVATAAQKLRDGAIKLDALVNNAGVMRGAINETNFFGPLRVTLAMRPLLREAATITNVTSTLADRVKLDAMTRDALVEHMRKSRDDYALSKAALNLLTRLLAAELAPIGVTAVDPGWCRTELGGRNAPHSVEQGAMKVVRVLRS